MLKLISRAASPFCKLVHAQVLSTIGNQYRLGKKVALQNYLAQLQQEPFSFQKFADLARISRPDSRYSEEYLRTVLGAIKGESDPELNLAGFMCKQMGIVMQRFDPQQSLNYCRMGIEYILRMKIPNPLELASQYLTLADALVLVGELELGVKTLEDAGSMLAEQYKSQEPPAALRLKAQVANRITQPYVLRGQREKGIAQNLKAIELWERIAGSQEELSMDLFIAYLNRINIAEDQTTLDERKRFCELLQKADRKSSKVKALRPNYLGALLAWAKLLKVTGQEKQAQECLARAGRELVAQSFDNEQQFKVLSQTHRRVASLGGEGK